VAQLTHWLWRERHTYAGCYVYNFDQPQFMAALLAKACLGKRLVVDYEDEVIAAYPLAPEIGISATLGVEEIKLHIQLEAMGRGPQGREKRLRQDLCSL